MTSSTKPEVLNILQHCKRRKEPRLKATCAENLVKFGHVICERSSRTDRQTQTDPQTCSFPDHCLHSLLPSKRNHIMKLRPKARSYTLPNIHTTLLKNSFVDGSIFTIRCSTLGLLHFYFFIHPVRFSLVITAQCTRVLQRAVL